MSRICRTSAASGDIPGLTSPLTSSPSKNTVFGNHPFPLFIPCMSSTLSIPSCVAIAPHSSTPGSYQLIAGLPNNVWSEQCKSASGGFNGAQSFSQQDCLGCSIKGQATLCPLPLPHVYGRPLARRLVAASCRLCWLLAAGQVVLPQHYRLACTGMQVRLLVGTQPTAQISQERAVCSMQDSQRHAWRAAALPSRRNAAACRKHAPEAASEAPSADRQAHSSGLGGAASGNRLLTSPGGRASSQQTSVKPTMAQGRAPWGQVRSSNCHAAWHIRPGLHADSVCLPTFGADLTLPTQPLTAGAVDKVHAAVGSCRHQVLPAAARLLQQVARQQRRIDLQVVQAAALPNILHGALKGTQHSTA